MTKITSIATGVPANKYLQSDLADFAQSAYADDEAGARKIKFLYGHSGISSRYSVLADFTLPIEQRSFFTGTAELADAPGIDARMSAYEQFAAPLSVETIERCIEGKINASEITHLVTVSCTGMSAPGLDLQILEAMGLEPTVTRTSVNFMGCYAAIHGMKIAQAFCAADPKANVVVVCVEFCSLHFQQTRSIDNLTSSLIFADGCAALLMQADPKLPGIAIDNFYSRVLFKGKKDMAWQLSPTGFLMTLSAYIPDLIKADFKEILADALGATGRTATDVTDWCIHPGGKKILEAITDSLDLPKQALQASYDVLDAYGNMSSPTILFVLKEIMDQVLAKKEPAVIFGAAFGPGLTMETFTASYG